MRRSGMLPVVMEVLALCLLLSACGGESSEGPAAQSAVAADTGPDTTRMYMVRMDGQRRPDMVGSAGFVPQGQRTLVVAGVRGAAVRGTLQGHIHDGDTCDSPGAPTLPLERITVGNDSTGRSMTTVAADIGSIFDGRHLIVFHQQGAEPGQAVVCGDIPVMVQ